MAREGQVLFSNRLADTSVFTQKELAPLLRAALKKNRLPHRDASCIGPYWPAAYFGLPGLSFYQRLSAEQQNQVLLACQRQVLEEAFYIEKTGMTYAAKMALLAPNNDERALYSLFAADEASHFHAICSYLDAEPQPYRKQAFVEILDQLVHQGSFNVLVYVVQIILEGWGLHHYLSLASSCQDPRLQELLRCIVQDEAKHHGSGLVILPQKSWSEEDRSICVEILSVFFNLVRIGPLNLAAATASVLGPWREADLEILFEETGGQAQIAGTLEVLMPLVAEHCPDAVLIETLMTKGLLTPATSTEFVQFARSGGLV